MFFSILSVSTNALPGSSCVSFPISLSTASFSPARAIVRVEFSSLRYWSPFVFCVR